MSRRKCCVPMCSITSKDDVHLHSFPDPAKDAERFTTWVLKIGGEIIGLDNNTIFKNRKVCHKHFPDNVIYLSNRLSKTAVPQLLLAGAHRTNMVINQADPVREDNLTMAIPEHNIDPVPSTSQAFTLPQKQHTKRVSYKFSQAEYIEVKNTMNKIKINMKKKNYKRIQYARNISKTRAFNILTKKMSANARKFFLMQITQSKKKLKGRRFTLDEKILALTLYKPSPKAYRLLRRICVLPSRRSLQKLLQTINLSPGYNEFMFKHLKKRVSKMPEKHRYCSLVFDEMAIAPSCTFNASRDTIEGFIDDGEERLPEFCDHVLVFMIRGVVKKYKQPVWFTYSASATKTLSLKNQINMVIRKLFEANLHVVATICDQGTSNIAAMNSLINDARTEMVKNNKEFSGGYFMVEDKKIFVLYDPPHLMKGIRNNFLNKNLRYSLNGKECVAKWEHIQLLYDRTPEYRGVKMMPKLTTLHVVPHLIPKMKVKYCTQVFSKTVGASIGCMAESGCIPQESTHTADLLFFFDELFDSVNGSYHQAVGGKIYRTAVTPKSPHMKLWNKSLPVLKTMKFETSLRGGVVPSITSWIKTVESFKNITLCLQKRGINSLLLRNFNQDALENFFGSIRAHGHANTMPSASYFETAYKTLILNNLTSHHAVGSNCEVDDGVALDSFKDLFNEAEALPMLNDDQVEIDFDHVTIENIDTDFLINNKDKQSVEKCAAIGYCSGWIAVKAKRAIYKNCSTCKKEMETENLQNFHNYIKIKEFENKTWLCYPTRCLFDFFAQVEHITYIVLKTKATKKRISEYIKLSVITNVDFNFLNCEKHCNNLKEFLINKCVAFFINNWCKEVGHLITGKMIVHDESDAFKNAARNIYLKGRGVKRQRSQAK